MRTISQLLAIILTTLLLPGGCFAAIPATMQWDVRTTGADTNGGGFTTGGVGCGTDYSLQNGAQVTYLDLVIGATTTQLTSVLQPIGATLVCNVINVTGGVGCTTGRYFMVSQAAAVATMDRSVGTAASVCTGNLGGSLLTWGTANGVTTNGNTVHGKTGTYTITGVITVTTNSIWSGYGTTHGDAGTRPLITTATNSTILAAPSTSAAVTHLWSAININFSNTAGTRAFGVQGANSNKNYVSLTNCNFDGFSSALDSGNNGASTFVLSGVEIKNSTGAGVILKEEAFSCLYCNIHNNGGAGVDVQANSVVVSFFASLITDNTGAGVTGTTGAAYTVNASNSTFANNGGDGIKVAPLNSNLQANIAAAANVFYNNVGYGINLSAAQNGMLIAGGYNAFGANSIGQLNNLANTPNDITLTANPFTSATNYALNSVSGGGAAIKGLSYTWPGGTTIGSINAGGASLTVPFTGAAAIR